ncbi:MAG: lipopolysaccharide biosynthesis protein [Capnocytophaga sp.]|nr:lipopolysaccharide biosynthesis protein [Capnocytophaga sp.]
MEENYKISNSKVTSSFLWVIIERFGYSGINLLSTLILARLLTPYEFGLVGSVAVIISISNMIVESGMGAALVNKKDTTNQDFNTVFTFNFLMSVTLFVIVFSLAPFIANYFKEPILKNIIRVLSLTLIFNAFTLIQRVVLIRSLLLKKQSFISIVSTLISAGIAIFGAYNGWGVWAIVIQSVLYATIFSTIIFLIVRYIPKFQFSSTSFKELLDFGGRIVLSSAIQVTYSDIISSVIAKVYTIQTTGLYSQSHKLIAFPLYFFRSLFDGAAFPILSKIKNKNDFKKMASQINRGIYFLAFPLLLVIPFNAEGIIEIVLGKNWIDASAIFKILSVGVIISIVDIATFSTLKSAGEGKIHLNMGINKAIIGLSFLAISISFSLDILLFGIILTNLITCFIAIYYVDRLTFYTAKEQLKDIAIPLVIAMIGNVAAFSILRFIRFDQTIVNLFTYIVIVGFLCIILCFLLGIKELKYIIKKIKK